MRLRSIDCLRGLAIVLVLFRHFGIIDILGFIGWSGVDLFFVLSGFLVSGLLFDEYKKTSAVNPLNFIIRRGLRIYPPFYLLILFTIAKSLIVVLLEIPGNQSFAWSRVLAEIFFMQNYFDRLWAHTWSLAIEEHFYLMLILLVMFLVQANQMLNTRLMIGMAVSVAFGCAILRYLNFTTSTFTIDTHMFYTHLRIDSLCFGVILSWFFHFHRSDYNSFVTRFQLLIALAGVCFVIPIFIFSPDTFVMNVFGLTITYLGFGCVLMLCVHHEHFLAGSGFFAKFIAWPFAYIGYHSYSVYLWHLPVLVYFAQPMSNYFGGVDEIGFILYFTGSIIVGVVAHRLIEKPILRLRDKTFAHVRG